MQFIFSIYYMQLRYYILLTQRLLLIMLLFSLCRIFFYWTNSDLFPDMTFERFMTIAGGGLRFDLTAAIYTNLVYIVISLLPFSFVYHKITELSLKILYVLTNALAFALNVGDMAYFRFTSRRMTFSFFKEFEHDNNLGSILWGAIGTYWYLWLLWIAIVAALWFCYGKIKGEKTQGSSRSAFRFAPFVLRTLILAAGIGLCVAGARGGFRTSTRPITLSNAGKYVLHPIETAIVLNTPFCIYRTTSRTDFKSLHYFETDEIEKIYTPVQQPSGTAPFKADNVVVIIVESLARFYVGGLNKDLPELQSYTPFLDSLIGHSHACCNAFANGIRSIEAIPSVLAGIPGLEQPYILTPYSLNKMEGLGALLRKKGYYTAFFHGAQNNSMGFSAIVKMLGFDHYYGRSEYNNDKDFDGVWGIWDEPFLQFYARQLGELPQPFATALFTLSSHSPFKVPEQYKGKFPAGPLENNECIGYTDYALRRFFDTAKTMPWYKNTLFVLTADHSSASEYCTAYQNTMNRMAIPIIYYHPGMETAVMDSSITEQTDILPTVLAYLNYDEPHLSFGRDQNGGQPPFVFNYHNGYQLLYNGYLLLSDGVNTTGFYRWTNRGFDGLGDNLAGQLPLQQAQSEQLFKALMQQYTNRMIENRLTAD